MTTELTPSLLIRNVNKGLLELFKTDLDKSLVTSYFIDNLSSQDILRLNKYDVRELVIIDYLLQEDLKKPNSLDLFLRRSFLDSILNKDFSEKDSKKKTLSISQTPEKQIAYLAYLSFLKNERSKILATKSKSKEDLKKVYCFDYLYPYISETRRKSLDLNPEKEVSEIMEKTVKTYKTQLLVQEVFQKRKDLESLIQNISSDEMLFKNIEEFQKFKENAYEYLTESSEDEELVLEFNKTRSLLNEGEYRIREKVESKINSDHSTLDQTLKILSVKDYLTRDDEKTLLESMKIVENLKKILAYTKVEHVDLRITLENLSNISNQDNYFKNNRKHINSHIKYIEENLKSIPKISVLKLSYEPNYKSIDKIINIYETTKNSQNNLRIHKENPYCKRLINSTKKISEELYVKMNKKIREINSFLEIDLSVQKQRQEKYKNKFLGLFFNSGIKNKIKRDEDYKIRLDVILTELNISLLNDYN